MSCSVYEVEPDAHTICCWIGFQKRSDTTPSLRCVVMSAPTDAWLAYMRPATFMVTEVIAIDGAVPSVLITVERSWW